MVVFFFDFLYEFLCSQAGMCVCVLETVFEMCMLKFVPEMGVCWKLYLKCVYVETAPEMCVSKLYLECVCSN